MQADVTARRTLTAMALALLTAFTGCTVEAARAPRSDRADAPAAPASRTAAAQIDPAQAERLKRAMLPLIRAMDKPRDPGRVKVGIINEPAINAANGGNDDFYVTTGLLQKANDDALLGVLAHEVAHEDLGHVAKAQALGTGLNIGMVILDQIIPGSGRLTPIAGTLLTRAYGRREEYEADRHGAVLLERVGKPRALMADTLTWLMQTEGSSKGGFFATHPATEDRIARLRQETSAR